MRRLAPALFVLIFGCGNCQIGTEAIPGGFDPNARIERAAQVRLTSSGLAALEPFVDALAKGASQRSCSSDLDCPVALGSSCVSSTCSSGSFAAIDLLPISSGAIDVCTSGDCRVYVAIDAVSLAQSPPSGLIATVSARLASTDIPIETRATGASCVAMLDAQGPAPIAIELAMAPSSSGRIGLTVDRVQLPAIALSGSCGAIQTDLARAIESAAVPVIGDLLASAAGQTCDADTDCPGSASCLAERCREDQAVLLPGLDEEARISIPPVLEAYDTPDAVSDLAIQLGGAISADSNGITAGVRAGIELVTPNPRCANVAPSPRLRPTFVAPPPLPATGAVDLDFDGVEETPYGLALALSKQFIDQAVWSAYGGGLLCGALSTADFDDLHTGTLEIIIPSVRFLAKSHLYPRSARPVRISAWLRQEPEIVLGSGESRDAGGTTEFVDPLVHLLLRDFEINVTALIEERWVRILTATIDIHLGVAVMVTPDNEIEPIVGVGAQEIISNIRITNHELLQEDPASIAQALPTLLSFALLELAGSAGQFPIPTLEGTDLEVLGIRGVPGSNGFDHAAVYADFTIAAGNLSPAAETDATLTAIDTPETEAFARGALPTVELQLSGRGTGQLEYQYRLDGGFWSPFTTNRSIAISRPELAIQGKHRIEVRARVKGDYRSLDPTPVAIDFWIDSEPPVLSIDRGVLTAWDRVSDTIRVEAIRAAGTEPISLDAEGRAPIAPDVLRVRAIDEAGLQSELVIQQADRAIASEAGCSAIHENDGSVGLLLLFALVLLIRRRSA